MRTNSSFTHSFNPHVWARQLSDPGILLRPFSPVLLHRHPPPPSVEDEAEALAREYASSRSDAASVDEEPKCRGDVEQLPIILPAADADATSERRLEEQPVSPSVAAPETNPERRFLLVSKHSHSDGEDYPYNGQPAVRPGYEANTGRKYSSARTEDKISMRPAEVKRRKSHIELPPLETGVASAGLHRTSSSASIHSKSRDDVGRERPRTTTAGGLLSPTASPAITINSTKGRDRAFFNFNPSNNTESSRTRYGDARIVNNDGRSSIRTGGLEPSVRPAAHQRANSAVEMPNSWGRPSETYTVRGETPNPRMVKRSASPPLGSKRSPTSERRPSSPPRDMEKLSRRR